MDVSEQDFANNTFILVKYAAKNFRHKINIPADFMTALPKMVPAFVALANKSMTVETVVATLQELIALHSGNKMFLTSVEEIKENLKSDSKPNYIWEMAADLVQLYNVLLGYLHRSLDAVGDTDAQIDAEIAKIPKYQTDLASSKPETARTPTEISLDFSNLANLRQLQAFAQAQTVSLLKCNGCQGRAVWFAIPCHHPVCCDKCKEQYPDFEECCPECYEEITELVRLTE